jgi:hypothetical protein
MIYDIDFNVQPEYSHCARRRMAEIKTVLCRTTSSVDFDTVRRIICRTTSHISPSPDCDVVRRRTVWMHRTAIISPAAVELQCGQLVTNVVLVHCAFWQRGRYNDEDRYFACDFFIYTSRRLLQHLMIDACRCCSCRQLIHTRDQASKHTP